MAPEPSPHINLEGLWLPKANSTLAPAVDTAWNIVMVVSIAFFMLLMGLMVYFAIRYRRRSDFDVTSDQDHNFRLEVAWTVIPFVLVIALFFVGFKGFLHAAVPPSETYDIQVTAQKWTWSFTYPNGVQTADLVVPQGRPIRLVMSSRDVIHSFYVPEFRVKRDVIPGLYTSLWFEAKEPTETVLECAEYCGGAGDGSRTTGHSGMWAHVTVLSGGDFDKWLAKIEEENNKLTPSQLGAKLYEEKGCKGCHSLDANLKLAGPTWQHLFGHDVQLSDGTTVKADENYIKESIQTPGAKVVAGYQNVMPILGISDKEVEALIAFIKEQK